MSSPPSSSASVVSAASATSSSSSSALPGVPEASAPSIGHCFFKLRHPRHHQIILHYLCGVPGCNKQYEGSTDTGSFYYHFNSKHAGVLERWKLDHAKVIKEFGLPPLEDSRKRQKRDPKQTTLNFYPASSSSSSSSSAADADDDDDDEDFTENLARLCAEEMLPFRLAELPTFRRLFPERDTFPSRQFIRKKVQNIAAQMRTQLLAKLKGQSVTVAIDGWTNINSVKVTNIVLCHDGKAYYWDSIHNKYEKNGAKWLTEEMIPVFELLIKEGLRITSVVADNENLNGAIFKLLKKKFPFLIRVPCAAHTIQLAVHDYLDSKQELMDKFNAMLHHFSSHITARRALLSAQRNSGVKRPFSLLKPCPTRWNSTFLAIRRAIQLRGYINEITPHSSETFWDPLIALRDQLQHFLKATDTLQSDGATLYDIWQQFTQLANQPALISTVRERWQSHVNTDAVYASAVLSFAVTAEQLKTQGLTTQLANAKRCILEFGVQYLRGYNLSTHSEQDLTALLTLQLDKFLLREGPSMDEHIERSQRACKVSETHWRPYHAWLSVDSELGSVARALLSIAASEAAVERTFSAQDAILTQKRNRLTDDIVKDLLFIKFDHSTLNSFTAEQHERSEVECEKDRDVTVLDEDYEAEDTKLGPAAAAAAALQRTAEQAELKFLNDYISQHSLSLSSFNHDRSIKTQLAQRALAAGYDAERTGDIIKLCRSLLERAAAAEEETAMEFELAEPSSSSSSSSSSSLPTSSSSSSSSNSSSPPLPPPAATKTKGKKK